MIGAEVSNDVDPQEALQWAARFLDYALMHPSNWSQKDNAKMAYCLEKLREVGKHDRD